MAQEKKEKDIVLLKMTEVKLKPNVIPKDCEMLRVKALIRKTVVTVNIPLYKLLDQVRHPEMFMTYHPQRMKSKV